MCKSLITFSLIIVLYYRVGTTYQILPNLWITNAPGRWCEKMTQACEKEAILSSAWAHTLSFCIMITTILVTPAFLSVFTDLLPKIQGRQIKVMIRAQNICRVGIQIAPSWLIRRILQNISLNCLNYNFEETNFPTVSILSPIDIFNISFFNKIKL